MVQFSILHKVSPQVIDRSCISKCGKIALIFYVLFRNRIQNSLPGSCVFFFTDADPKDPELESQVVQTARNKDIHLMLFLRGQCDGGLQEDNSSQPSCVRRNDRENVGSRRKREIGGMFSSLASSTSSSTVKVPNSAISKTIGDIIDVQNFAKA
ncbi:hypothetical protein KUTeg_006241 [Tegillarca granosa]|uniref:Hemicentin-1-like von Willebrand factor A domain-containing protein n=1 Tax=Tegillarca granosa TaxID=220873 RepID=A0ABQ9FJW8_TEGGR|nr:hypothetical protein KUTeg_006241 [Tegillarca granosa]